MHSFFIGLPIFRSANKFHTRSLPVQFFVLLLMSVGPPRLTAATIVFYMTYFILLSNVLPTCRPSSSRLCWSWAPTVYFAAYIVSYLLVTTPFPHSLIPRTISYPSAGPPSLHLPIPYAHPTHLLVRLLPGLTIHSLVLIIWNFYRPR